MANWKWRYRTTDGFLPGGCGDFPNGFSANELHPISPNFVQEAITPAQAQAFMADVEANPTSTFTRTGAGTYAFAKR